MSIEQRLAELEARVSRLEKEAAAATTAEFNPIIYLDMSNEGPNLNQMIRQLVLQFDRQIRLTVRS
jgi:hypothetical protein